MSQFFQAAINSKIAFSFAEQYYYSSYQGNTFQGFFKKNEKEREEREEGGHTERGTERGRERDNPYKTNQTIVQPECFNIQFMSNSGNTNTF